MPVDAIARESRNLGADDEAHLAEADVGDQSLEALATGGLLAGLALVLINEQDLVLTPAPFEQATAQSRRWLTALSQFLTTCLGVDCRR